MNIFDTNVLVQVVPNLMTSQNWLLDRFFPNVVTYETEEVSIDVDIGKRRMAPFVSPLVEGKLVEQRKYQTNTFNSHVATGDQGRVADHLYAEHNVTAEVWVCSPIKHPVNFTISGIKTASADTKKAINDAIDKVFFTEGQPGVKPAVDTPPVEIDLSSIELAIANVPGTKGFLLVQPSSNISLDVGQLPLRGTVTYT